MGVEQLTLGVEAPRSVISAERISVPLSALVVDPAIYPREEVDHKRIERYAAVMRDGVAFPLMHIQIDPTDAARYRVLDGAHRLGAYRATGREAVEALLVDLNGLDPLLYAASCQTGPKELREVECRDVARRAYTANPDLTSAEIAVAVGRSRDSVDDYIRDLRAAGELATDLLILRMIRLGIPQERIAARLDWPQQTVAQHLPEMGALPFPVNADLERGFPAAQVAEKYGWPEPLVWALGLDSKTDAERFDLLRWGLRTWDTWGWADVDARFGDEWPGRIPAQLVGHALYYFTRPGDLVFDPMAGGGVVPDVCLALGRRCWAFDLDDRPETRPEIEPHVWESGNLIWPVNGKAKPDLIFFDPPYFDKKDAEYADGSISRLSRADYLQFFADFCALAREHTKPSTRLAFLNADWRDFQGTAALDEKPQQNIDVVHYAAILEAAGWERTHIIDAPLSSERFSAGVVKQMQGSRILGVVRRTLIVARRRA